MRKEMKSFVAVVLAFVVVAIPISSFAEYELKYNGGDSPFYISGQTDKEKSGQPVGVSVFRETQSVYAKQKFTNDGGVYDFCFEFDGYGDAKLYVSEDGQMIDMDIYKSTPLEVSNVISRLNSDESEKTIIEEQYKVLGIDLTHFSGYSPSELFLKILSIASYTDILSFHDEYDKAEFLTNISRATSGDTVATLFEDYDGLPDFTQKFAGTVFNDYTDTQKKVIYGLLAGESFSSLDALLNAVYKEVILYEIASVSSYSEKFKIISDNNDNIGLDLSKYVGFGIYIEDFKKELVATPFTDLAAIKTKYNELCIKYGNIDAGGDDGSGSLGGNNKKSDTVSVGTELLGNEPIQNKSYFNDLAGYDWAVVAINSLAGKGAIGGKSEGVFAPQDNITRAEFIKILSGAFGLSGNVDKVFADCPSSHWSYPYVSAAVKNGITNGISNEIFGVNENITRQDMAVFCYRVANMMKNNLPQKKGGNFRDNDSIADYAKEAVFTLKTMKIINGKGDNEFQPLQFATRAEAAKIVYELLQY